MRIEAVEKLVDRLEQELGSAGAVGELRVAARTYLERAYGLGLDEGYAKGYAREWDRCIKLAEESVMDEHDFEEFLSKLEAKSKEKGYAQFNVDLNE